MRDDWTTATMEAMNKTMPKGMAAFTVDSLAAALHVAKGPHSNPCEHDTLEAQRIIQAAKGGPSVSEPTTPTEALEEMLATLFDRGMYGGMEPSDILAALPEGTALVTVDSLADIVERHVLPDDYYRTEPDTPVGPWETWFDAGTFADAIIQAAKGAEQAEAPTSPLPHVEHVGPHEDFPAKEAERE